MNHARGRHGAREYFWFALALIVLLMGSAARAAAAEGATSKPVDSLAISIESVVITIASIASAV